MYGSFCLSFSNRKSISSEVYRKCPLVAIVALALLTQNVGNPLVKSRRNAAYSATTIRNAGRHGKIGVGPQKFLFPKRSATRLCSVSKLLRGFCRRNTIGTVPIANCALKTLCHLPETFSDKFALS